MTGETAGSAFLRDLDHLSTIGATARGGVDREAGTVPDAMARSWLGGWLATRGFRVVVDAIGNQYGLIDLVPGAPYVFCGSHLDSQPRAGRLDGAYGVLAAAHAAQRLAQRHQSGGAPLGCNIAVVNWFNEEGSRFAPSMMGSGVFAGRLDLAVALETRDVAGTSVRDALDRMDARGELPAPVPAAYAEIHIEQGRELEESGDRIGVVTGTWAARKFRFRVLGEQAHTGATRMGDRRDAVLAAARMVVEARAVADRAGTGRLHSAVSQLEISPNSPVVVAREVVGNLDLRSPEPAVLESAVSELRIAARRVEAETGVGVELDLQHGWDRDDFRADVVGVSEDVCREFGVPARRMLTVAGHDATNVKDLVPTAMLFVPSVGGVSHNEGEYTDPADLATGVNVLTGVVDRLCARVAAPPARDYAGSS